jgi:hypothetical protein
MQYRKLKDKKFGVTLCVTPNWQLAILLYFSFINQIMLLLILVIKFVPFSYLL